MEVDASSSIFDLFWVQHSTNPITDEEHCILNVGGVDLGLHCSDHHKNPAKFDTNKIAQIVADHIILSNFDVFCVQGISTAVLTTVLGIIREADKAWESTNCANPDHDAPSMSHVIFYKTTMMVFVAKAISVLKGDKLYERIVKEFPKFFGVGLVDELPVDSSGFVGIYKLVSIDRYVKILSLALPPLTKEKPPRHKHGELFRNLSLKKALFTLFYRSNWISPSDVERKSIYFVYGSIEVIAGMDLLNSSVHRILTGESVIMILPQDDIDSFEHPNPSTMFMGEMEYFDPERVVPLRKQGLSSFIYVKGADIMAVYKYQTMETASAKRGIYDYPCGGRFLMFPIPWYSSSEYTTDASDEELNEGKVEVSEEKSTDDEADEAMNEEFDNMPRAESTDEDADETMNAELDNVRTSESIDGEPYADSADAAEESIHEDPDETSEESTEESIHEDPDKTSGESTEESIHEDPDETSEESTEESIHEDPDETSEESTEESIHEDPDETSEESTEESIHEDPDETSEESTEESIYENPDETSDESTEELIHEDPDETSEESTEESTVEETKQSTDDSTKASADDSTKESTAGAREESAARKREESIARKREESTTRKREESAAGATEESTADATKESTADATEGSTAGAREESTAEKTDGKPIETEKLSEATEKSTVERHGKPRAEAKQSTASEPKQSVAAEPKQSTDEAIKQSTEQSPAEAIEETLEQSAAEAAEQSLAEATEQSNTKNKLLKKQKFPAQHCPKRRKPKKK